MWISLRGWRMRLPDWAAALGEFIFEPPRGLLCVYRAECFVLLLLACRRLDVTTSGIYVRNDALQLAMAGNHIRWLCPAHGACHPSSKTCRLVGVKSELRRTSNLVRPRRRTG